MINLKETGTKLRNTRLNKNLTVNEVSEAIFVTPPTIRNWERGKHLTLDGIVRLAEFYGCYIDVLVVTD